MINEVNDATTTKRKTTNQGDPTDTIETKEEVTTTIACEWSTMITGHDGPGLGRRQHQKTAEAGAHLKVALTSRTSRND